MVLFGMFKVFMVFSTETICFNVKNIFIYIIVDHQLLFSYYRDEFGNFH